MDFSDETKQRFSSTAWLNPSLLWARAAVLPREDPSWFGLAGVSVTAQALAWARPPAPPERDPGCPLRVTTNSTRATVLAWQHSCSSMSEALRASSPTVHARYARVLACRRAYSARLLLSAFPPVPPSSSWGVSADLWRRFTSTCRGTISHPPTRSRRGTGVLRLCLFVSRRPCRVHLTWKGTRNAWRSRALLPLRDNVKQCKSRRNVRDR